MTPIREQTLKQVPDWQQNKRSTDPATDAEIGQNILDNIDVIALQTCDYKWQTSLRTPIPNIESSNGP